MSFARYCWLHQSSGNNGKALAGHFKAGCKGEIHQVETEINEVETEIHQVEKEIHQVETEIHQVETEIS